MAIIQSRSAYIGRTVGNCKSGGCRKGVPFIDKITLYDIRGPAAVVLSQLRELGLEQTCGLHVV